MKISMTVPNARMPFVGSGVLHETTAGFANFPAFPANNISATDGGHWWGGKEEGREGGGRNERRQGISTTMGGCGLDLAEKKRVQCAPDQRGIPHASPRLTSPPQRLAPQRPAFFSQRPSPNPPSVKSAVNHCPSDPPFVSKKSLAWLMGTTGS